MRGKEGKSGQPRGHTTEPMDFFFLRAQGMLKTLHIKISERRGQERMSVRRKPRWREANQPVSSRPLLLGKLGKWVNFLVLSHC